MSVNHIGNIDYSSYHLIIAESRFRSCSTYLASPDRQTIIFARYDFLEASL